MRRAGLFDSLLAGCRPGSVSVLATDAPEGTLARQRVRDDHLRRTNDLATGRALASMGRDTDAGGSARS